MVAECHIREGMFAQDIERVSALYDEMTEVAYDLHH